MRQHAAERRQQESEESEQTLTRQQYLHENGWIDPHKQLFNQSG